MAEPTSALDQLRSFSQALVSFADPDTPASPDFTYDTWEHALRQVSLLAKEKRIAVLIDEVTYIMDVNPNIVGALQKAWDHWLSKSNLMLALCGSQMGLMQRHLLDYQAPLYGRATAQLKLLPLPFGATGRFFPKVRGSRTCAALFHLGWRPSLLGTSRYRHDDPRESSRTANAVQCLDVGRITFAVTRLYQRPL